MTNGSLVSFAVLAHRNPQQVGRLVAMLGPERTVVHVDAATDDATAERMFQAAKGAQRVPRRRTPWGSWSIVRAVLDGAAILLHDPAVTHVCVCSGQDLPLVPPSHMDDLLQPGVSFARTTLLPSPLHGRAGGMDRLQYRHWTLNGRKVRLPLPRLLPGMRYAYGSPWSIFAREHIDTMLEVARRSDRFWRRTWVPDETFFATVLATHHPDEVTGSNPGYTEWVLGAAHPRTFTAADVPKLATLADRDVGDPVGRNWTARKFDDEDGTVTRQLTAALDTQVLSHEPLTVEGITLLKADLTPGRVLWSSKIG